jgi:hypothetical protein
VQRNGDAGPGPQPAGDDAPPRVRALGGEPPTVAEVLGGRVPADEELVKAGPVLPARRSESAVLAPESAEWLSHHSMSAFRVGIASACWLAGPAVPSPPRGWDFVRNVKFMPSLLLADGL